MAVPVKLVGWRSVGFFGGLASLIGVAVYSAVIYPYLNIDKYKAVQKVTRAGIDQEAIQPGGMKVWTDPFKSPK